MQQSDQAKNRNLKPFKLMRRAPAIRRGPCGRCFAPGDRARKCTARIDAP
jgi:hypothetical protein